MTLPLDPNSWAPWPGPACHKIRPGYIDFPPRCALRLGHTGPHRTKPVHLPPYGVLREPSSEVWED